MSTTTQATSTTTTSTTRTGNVSTWSSSVPFTTTSDVSSTIQTASPTSETNVPFTATASVPITNVTGGTTVQTATVSSTKTTGVSPSVTTNVSTGNHTIVGTTSGPAKNSTSSLMTTSKPCGPPDLISNGYIKSREPYYPNGTRAEYSCFTGYTLQGASYIICTSASVWSSLPPACIPVTEALIINKHSSVDTDVDVDVDVAVQASQDLAAEWKFPLAIIIGSIICLALLGFLLVWCCKASGCFHGNAVMPYNSNYVEQGRCCCKRYVLMNTDQRAGSIRSTIPQKMPRPSVTTQVPGYYDETPIASSGRHDGCYDNTIDHDPDDGIGHAPNDPDRKVPLAKQPATWMPHAKPKRKINTSTK